MAKRTIVLFNLGGPSSLSGVETFLYNLFSDPAIISLPNPFRYLLAKLISKKRKQKAEEIYKKMGGRSPILELTLLQAKALEELLKIKAPQDEYQVVVSMRYTYPFAQDSWEEIEKFSPSEIILLPLYPQFSTTTSFSSLKNYRELLKHKNFQGAVKSVCCYPTEKSFIKSHQELILDCVKKENLTNYRVLFSAHGLPEKVINKGDPYKWQIEETVKAIIDGLEDNLDYSICYQSKVGPLKWIGPDTISEIIRAGKDKKNILMVPISFVSDHSETLVELDIEYKVIAKNHEIKEYVRVEALNTQKLFIESLAEISLTLAKNNDLSESDTYSEIFKRICPKEFKSCPNKVFEFKK